MPVVDASVVVSWLVPEDSNSDTARHWMQASLRAGISLNVPSIILPEVAASISRARGGADLAKQLLADFLAVRNLNIFPLTESRALTAARLGAELQIRGCDAVYVALAAELDDVLVTFDRQQLDRARSAVTVLQPD